MTVKLKNTETIFKTHKLEYLLYFTEKGGEKKKN